MGSIRIGDETGEANLTTDFTEMKSGGRRTRSAPSSAGGEAWGTEVKCSERRPVARMATDQHQSDRPTVFHAARNADRRVPRDVERAGVARSLPAPARDLLRRCVLAR